MAQQPNNTANVSTLKGVKGAYFFSAPRNDTTIAALATLLAKTGLERITTPIPDAIPNMGYVSSDGFTEGVDQSSESLTDVNGDTVDTYGGSATETMGITVMETKAGALGLYYGSANVTDDGGLIEVEHNWANAEEERIVIFDGLLKNGRRMRKVIERAKVTERGEFTGNATTAAQRNLTLTYLDDGSGSNCHDWIESTETPAPVLSALSISGTGTSLSPSFSASVRAYASAATGSSVTVTATSSDGTVAIKDANGNSYSSGGSVPLIAGTNVITITVTDAESGAVGTYTLTVTKS